jgi:uncharacterized glyoxalase superfamily protein PhnB
MTDNAKNTKVTVIPTLRYRDAPAAIDWLCKAFGFEKHLIIPGDNGMIVHAQLTFGNGMIMLGSARDDEFGKLQAPPIALDGIVAQSPYIIIEDVDRHHARAVAEGAKVVIAPHDEDYGGRDYSCRDIEGYLWNFGNYDPWTPA